ncbi:hypothetical protein BD560DRAFT_431853 [Blakeslea trispora]|nr:hypothetical protein BD560DRAFT_431853 [Blakeslea trispora]
MENQYLQVAILPGKGRGYKATQRIDAGTVVHISEPIAAIVSHEWTPETCFWCFNFSYPKKQKVKVLTEIDRLALAQAWNLCTSKQIKNNKLPVFLSSILFCSEQCRDTFKQTQSSSDEWEQLLAAYHRIDVEFKKSEPTIRLEEAFAAKPSASLTIDSRDDEILMHWLDQAWDILQDSPQFFNREIETSDVTMCRLIATCIVRKNTNEISSTYVQPFENLLVIQNNELSHFRAHCSHVMLPKLDPTIPNQALLLLQTLPVEVLDIMALYTFLRRALTTPLFNIPTIVSVTHNLFRAIFFRERANSFGLWELPKHTSNQDEGAITDDLELLGWGIYPSAVYFNHSCDANVIKGQEACISYGAVHEPVETRRARLLEHYHFECQCTRCIDEINT